MIIIYGDIVSLLFSLVAWAGFSFKRFIFWQQFFPLLLNSFFFQIIPFFYFKIVMFCLQIMLSYWSLKFDVLLIRMTYCYVMQAVVSVSCLGDKSSSHAKWMSIALTQLLIFRLSCLLTNKGIVQCIDNSN